MLSRVMLLCAMVSAVVAVEGVSAERIRIGQCAALDGPAKALGLNMHAGLKASFQEANNAGGIHGRQVELIAVDDGYEPERCVEGTLRLIEDEQVFALAGYVGTPTAKVATPIVADMQVPLVGLFTGAGFLRDPQDPAFPLVINLRASYDEETEALVEHLTKTLGFERIAVFIQDDSFGMVGLSGTQKALGKRGLSLAGEGRYERNTTAVQSGLAKLLAIKPQAVVMVGAYKPLAEFARQAKAASLGAVLCTISFVGTEAIIADLGADDAEGLMISQVVPSPTLSNIPAAQAFRAALASSDPQAQVTYGAFEGYLTGCLLLAGLRLAGENPERQALIAAFEHMQDFDLGGLKANMNASDHQALDRVYLTQVRAGNAVPLDAP